VGGGGLAGWGAEFGQHGGDVVVDGLGGDEQLGGDLDVGVSGADQLEHLMFAAGQPGRIGPGGCPP
jgi:hypothetical protein